MLRKQIIPFPSGPTPSVSQPPVIDVPRTATVLLTSESPAHPIEHAFDGNGGPGGTRWVAGELGEQAIILVFDAPQTLHSVALEIEESEVARTQELQLALSEDGGQSYREVLRQEYNFNPAGATFEHEQWTVAMERVTHLRLVIKPDKGGQPCRATLTSLVLC